jgi:hypothetical protein
LARKPTGNPTGRPEKEIDWNMFEQLCHIQCTQTEIASFFKIHHDTLADRVVKQYGDTYSSIYKRYADGGKMSLRRMQLKLAQKNAAMAIWLGKQYLGQRDKEIGTDNELDAIRKIAQALADLPAAKEVERPTVAAGQPVLDQRSEGKQSSIQNELGSA